jgi:hypothetical protein
MGMKGLKVLCPKPTHPTVSSYRLSFLSGVESENDYSIFSDEDRSNYVHYLSLNLEDDAMREKILATLFSAILLAMPLAMAQGEQDVVVPVGETVTKDMIKELIDEQVTANLGGLVSAVTDHTTIIRYLMFGATRVWESVDEDTTPINSFILMAFDSSGQQYEGETVTRGALFETSQTGVDVRGVTGTWSTYNNQFSYTPTISGSIGSFEAQGDTASPCGFNVVLPKRGGIDLVNTGTNNGWKSTSDINGKTICKFQNTVGTGWCVVAVGDATKECRIAGETHTAIGLTNFKWTLINQNTQSATYTNDGATINQAGFEVDAITGQTLALIPPDTYDIYAVY